MKKVFRIKLNQAKAEAERIQAAAKRMGLVVSKGQALELAAAAKNHENWHVYRNILEAEASQDVPVIGSQATSMLVGLYKAYMYEDGQFIAADTFLSSSKARAEDEMLAKHGHLKLTDEDADPTVVVDSPVYDIEPAQIVQWLTAEGLEESDLDDLVHDLAQEKGLSDLNSINNEDSQVDNEHAQDDYVSSVEIAASIINNMGMDSQLEFLRENNGTWLPLVTFLHETFGLSSWPKI